VEPGKTHAALPNASKPGIHPNDAASRTLELMYLHSRIWKLAATLRTVEPGGSQDEGSYGISAMDGVLLSGITSAF